MQRIDSQFVGSTTDTPRLFSTIDSSKLFGGAGVPKVVNVGSAIDSSKIFGLRDLGEAVLTRAASEQVASRAVRWVDALPDQDSRAVIVKAGAVVLGLAAVITMYEHAGIETVALLWTLYYVLDFVNSLVDRAQG
jgi:hypothetical protein